MNYFLLADILWYLGHIITGSSILFSRTNYYVAVYLVFIIYYNHIKAYWAYKE